MPRYEYKCKECNDAHDQFHSFDDAPGPCPCGALPESLTKVLSAPAIRMGGRQTMSTRHTTTETFGPSEHGGSQRIGKMEYFPEEVSAKKAELKKKEEGKGATVAGISIPKSSKKK